MSDNQVSRFFEEPAGEERDPFLDRMQHDASPEVTALRLPMVKITILKMDPKLDVQGARFKAAVFLWSASLFVDAHVDQLVQFTGYPMMFIVGIAQQMRGVVFGWVTRYAPVNTIGPRPTAHQLRTLTRFSGCTVTSLSVS
jgi:hypothetical protein